MKHNIVKSNLMLLSTQPYDELKIGADGRLEVGQIKKRDQAKLREVIEETFAFASKDEDADHRLWVKVRADDTTVTYASPGHVLEVVKRTFPDLRVEGVLSPEEETEEKVELVLAGESFYADKRALIESSEMLEKLFTGGFAEEAKKGIELQPPDYLTDFVNDKNFKVAVASLQGEPLPEGVDVNDYIELALIFDYFEAKDLREGSCRIIANAKLEPEELLTLLRYPTNLFLDVVCEIEKESFKALYFYLQMSSVEDLKNLGVTEIVKTPLEKVCRITSVDWDVSISDLVVSMINRKKLPLSFFGIQEFSRFVDLVGDSIASLEHFDFRSGVVIYTTGFKSDDLRMLAEKCPDLRSLVLPANISGDILKHLKSFPKLTHLNLAYCDRLRPGALESLEYTPLLEFLDLFHCSSLARDELKHLVHTPKLTHLNLGNCDNLGPGALEPLKYTPLLEFLDLFRCSNLAPDELNHLVHTPELTHLDISECGQLDRNAVPENLRHLLPQDGE